MRPCAPIHVGVTLGSDKPFFACRSQRWLGEEDHGRPTYQSVNIPVPVRLYTIWVRKSWKYERVQRVQSESKALSGGRLFQGVPGMCVRIWTRIQRHR